MTWQVRQFSVEQFDSDLFALCRAVPYLDHLLSWMEEAHAPLRAEDRLRRNHSIEIARTGSFAIRLPQTGVALRSGRSVMLADKTVFFGVQGRPDLILAASRVGFGQPLTSVLLPQRRIVINVHGPLWNVDAEQAAQAMALFGRHATDRAGAATAAPLLITGDPNYAHHMWNQLGALDAILAQGIAVQVAATHQPIAPLAEIFADRPWLQVRPIASRELPTLDPRSVLPFPAGGTVVVAAVRDRILRVAARHAATRRQDFLEATQGLRRIWLTVRTGTRTAVNLVDALVAIIAALLAEGGHAFVLDGFSRPNDYATNDDYDKAPIEHAIALETRVVQALRMKLHERIGEHALRRLHPAIGIDLLESIHLAANCHAYFAHHGTLQHKLGYFTRVPGLVHSNPGILAFDRAGTHRHVTEDAGAVAYIDGALVDDMVGVRGGLHHANNYRFNDIPRLVSVFRDFVARHATAAAVATLACLLSASAVAADPTGFDATPFDAPLAVRSIDLGPADTVPPERKQLRCTYYAGFMVKEIDEREVGDARISILPVAAGKPPPCRHDDPHERIVGLRAEGSYFAGAYAGYAFFNAADSVHGGLGFAVMRPPAMRILYSAIAKGPLTLAPLPHDAISIGFRAIHAGTCSVIEGGAACAEQIARDIGVKPPDLAICRSRYAQVEAADTKGWCQPGSPQSETCVQQQAREAEWDASPTFFVYPVAVTLDPKGATALPSGVVDDCWPSE